MEIKKLILDESCNAYLTCYLQEVGGKFVFEKRPGIIVIPGGAYAYCSPRESEPIALSYAQAGYQVFVLNYTCKDKGGWPKPLLDYEQAYELIIEQAEKWHLDANHLSVIGFSAGGHLAACCATMSKYRPNATILIYPALVRDVIDLCQPNLPEPHLFVDYLTCPCFLAAAQDDATVAIKSALTFELKLAEYAIPFESHIYAYGGHGFSLGRELNEPASLSLHVEDWVQDSIEWLSEVNGKLTRHGLTAPNPLACKNGDTNPNLSIDCSLKHLLEQHEEVLTILEPVLHIIKEQAKALNVSEDSFVSAFKTNTLRKLLGNQTFESLLEEINQKLSRIPNKI